MLMPLKVALEIDDTVDSILPRIVSALRQSYRHARYPLIMLATRLNMAGQGQDRLFDVLLSFELQDYATYFDRSATSEPMQMLNAMARYPLSVTVCEFHQDQAVEVVLASSDDYFTAKQTESLGNRIMHLMLSLMEQPHLA